MKKFFKNSIREIGHHAGVLVRGIHRVVYDALITTGIIVGVLVRGIHRVVYGALITTGIIVGVWGLTRVSAVEGWDAVLVFASSLCCLLGSVVSAYLTGLYVERGSGK